MVSKPQAFPRRLFTLPEMKTLPFAGLRWILDASRFLKNPSPRSRSLSRSRKHRQGVHRPFRSSLVDGLFNVCTCMSAIGTKRTWRDVRVESVVRSKADINDGRDHRSLTSFRFPQCFPLREVLNSRTWPRPAPKSKIQFNGV